MKQEIKNILDSFNNNASGWSARKLSAFFAVVLMGGYVTYKYGNENNAIEMLMTWLLFALLCLGLISFEEIIKFKNGTTTDTNSPDSDKLQGDKTE